MIQILNLLQKSKEKWWYENDELVISSDDVLSKFNELHEALSKNEATIDKLSSEFVDTL